ncbi:hypothetical protein ACHQM5_007167 [Ranunculus cassubicifolius]
MYLLKRLLSSSTFNLQSLAPTITTSPLKLSLPAPSSSVHKNSYQVYTNNRRINFLIKNGNFNQALQLFDEMPTHDAISFNLIITAYARNGCSLQALEIFKEMVCRGIRETSFTFSSLLSVCKGMGFRDQGLQVHCRAICVGCDLDLFVGSALVDFYMQNGCFDDALKVFDEMPERNLATWNSVLRGVCRVGCLDKLLGFFVDMRLDGVEANEVTLSYVINGCSVGQLLDQGKQMHCHVIKRGWVASSVFVVNALVDLYSNCGNLIDAEKAFESISPEDIISWNSIIHIYANNLLSFEAIEAFRTMRSWEKKPSVRSFLGFLSLSSSTQNVRLGRQIHAYVLKVGFDQEGNHVRSALIDMYGKCGLIESSVQVFEDISERTLECCNSMMTSLLHCGFLKDVIEMFGLMVDEGVRLDEVSFSTTLKALSQSASASLMNSELVHCCVIKSGFNLSTVVSCSLIDTYSRSGHINLSGQIFNQILEPNLICFTSMITGYARNGMGKKGLEMLRLLRQRGLKPDEITLLSVLTGCSHAGLVEEGLSVFKSMNSVYGVHPDRRHYSCMVDLLGRAGLLEEAEELLKSSCVKEDTITWTSLLGNCRIHKNKAVGNRAAEALMELHPTDPAAYVQASGFYSEIGDVEASMRVRELKMVMKIKREFGYSLIETSNHG